MKHTEAPLMTLDGLSKAYRNGARTPMQVLNEIRQRIEQFRDHNIWIHVLSETELAPYLENLKRLDPARAPLWGVPFAIKDNIDLAGVPTTAACEAFSYVPERSAFVVEKLISAGAIPVGKTNLDQFATGLNGTRSPWGACRNAFDDAYISGGSSSGSAVAVALGLAAFSLGTDTAGSGRVPAGFNNLVGVKPTRGLLSASGMVPACRSLDCMTVFALNCEDANQVLSVAEGYDPEDAYSRPNPFRNGARQFGWRDGTFKIGVIAAEQLKFFEDTAYLRAHQETLASLRAAGMDLVELDYAPFDETARLLYEGPWVAERYLATHEIIEQQPEAMHPVVRSIIEGGEAPKATALFAAQYRLERLKKICWQQFDDIDCLLTPTAGRLFTLEELEEEPVRRNSELGYYTNFMNLLDLSSVALPARFTEAGLPFGITLVGRGFEDRSLLSIALRLQALFDLPVGTRGERPEADPKKRLPGYSDLTWIDVLVCGAHLEGLPLNWQLQERGAQLSMRTHTAPFYRMYALEGGPPYRPGLVLDKANGAAIEVEVWRVPASEFGSFVAGIPAPLGIGKVQLESGQWISGFICEPCGLDGATEITHLGGWRAYLEQRK